MMSGRGPVLILLRLVKWKAAYSASLCEGYCWSGSEWSLFLGFLLEGSVLVIRHAIFENKLLNWNDILTLKVDVASLITASIVSGVTIVFLFLLTSHEFNYFPFFSSGVLDTSERDSNRKTLWNSAINEPDRTSASSSSEYSPVSTLRKSTKSRNEATLLFRFVGDINILVTPLILEALQRFVAKPLQFALFCFFLINSLWRLILTFCLPS